MKIAQFRDILDSQLRNLIERIENKHNDQIERLEEDHLLALREKALETTNELVGRRSELIETNRRLQQKIHVMEDKIERLEKLTVGEYHPVSLNYQEEEIERLEKLTVGEHHQVSLNYQEETDEEETDEEETDEELTISDSPLLDFVDHQEETGEENDSYNSQGSGEGEEELFTNEFNSYFNNQKYPIMLENISLKGKILNLMLQEKHKFHEDEDIKKDDICEYLYYIYNKHIPKEKIDIRRFIWFFWGSILNLESEPVDLEEFHKEIKNHDPNKNDAELTITNNPPR